MERIGMRTSNHPVLVDGVLHFKSIGAAARYAYHQGWCPSERTAKDKIGNAVRGVNHTAYGHRFEKDTEDGEA